MSFYGFWNNVAVLRLSVGTNAWDSFTSLFLFSQVNSLTLHVLIRYATHLFYHQHVLYMLMHFLCVTNLRKEISTSVVG